MSSAPSRPMKRPPLARANGVEHVALINNGYEVLEKKKKVCKLINGEGVHAVFDSIGQATFESGLNIVRRLGILVLFGCASGEIPVRLAGKIVKLTWATVYTAREELDDLVRDTLEYLKKGQMKVAIHRVYSVEDVQLARLDLEGRKANDKLLLKIQ